MQHENNRASRDTDEQCHGNGQADQQQPATERIIRPGMTMPPVLVTEPDNGMLIRQVRPEGPRVRLSPTDGVALMREWASALGRTELTAAGDDQGEAR